jgi:hypothetical protein
MAFFDAKHYLHVLNYAKIGVFEAKHYLITQKSEHNIGF